MIVNCFEEGAGGLRRRYNMQILTSPFSSCNSAICGKEIIKSRWINNRLITRDELMIEPHIFIYLPNGIQLSLAS